MFPDTSPGDYYRKARNTQKIKLPPRLDPRGGDDPLLESLGLQFDQRLTWRKQVEATQFKFLALVIGCYTMP